MRVCFHGVFGEVTTMPGNSQIAISHAVFVPSEHRGKGLGSAAHAERLKWLKENGYDYVLCTVRADNLAQQAVLHKFKWAILHRFVSSRTQETILVYGRATGI